MSNVKTSHNLRDFYYRDIILGEQSEPVYEPTNNSEIALAFRETMLLEFEENSVVISQRIIWT